MTKKQTCEIEKEFAAIVKKFACIKIERDFLLAHIKHLNIELENKTEIINRFREELEDDKKAISLKIEKIDKFFKDVANICCGKEEKIK